jgi:hypothetical protein
MSKELSVTVRIRLPWWASVYVWAFRIVRAVTGQELDAERHAQFIVKHAKVSIRP